MTSVKHISLVISLSALAGCGSGAEDAANFNAELNANVEAQLTHRIQPLGVNSSCFGSYERLVRDHRYNPPRRYSLYLLGMKACSAAASSLVIQMLGGQQWIGGYSYVTIKKNGLCLTNPVSRMDNSDRGETFWKTCVAQNSASTDRFRQQWILMFNNNNALQIQTRTALNLGLANAQAQCLDRQDPTTIKRVTCSLHNWQVVRAN